MLTFNLPPSEIYENLMIYPLIPKEANQGWKMELLDLRRPTSLHYHKIKRQYILLLEGEMKVRIGKQFLTASKSGKLFRIDPGVVHSIEPEKRCVFLSIELPLAESDTFSGEPVETTPEVTPWSLSLPMHPFEQNYFASKYLSETHVVYDLVPSEATGGHWSAALIDIKDVPSHYHRIETEHFIVLHGTLEIAIDGTPQFLNPGDSITLHPGQAHHLKSVSSDPVRVLCLNFPAFDPSDMHFK